MAGKECEEKKKGYQSLQAVEISKQDLVHLSDEMEDDGEGIGKTEKIEIMENNYNSTKNQFWHH